MVFPRLRLWLDPLCRPGPEAMAVDEWLHETADEPLLRVYRWQGAWGSIGVFGRLAEAREALPGLHWVRRWTGGGVVDHRRDWTYSVIAPAGCALAAAGGAESYRLVHTALVAALADGGETAELSPGDATPVGDLCFRNPVRHDLVGGDGGKIAGAGQRRTRRGLLHQGSVALALDGNASAALALRLAGALAGEVEEVRIAVGTAEIRERVARRYGDPGWTERR